MTVIFGRDARRHPVRRAQLEVEGAAETGRPRTVR